MIRIFKSLAVVLLSGCTLALPDGAPEAPKPIMGDAIAVTPLPPTRGGAVAPEAAANPAPSKQAPAPEATPVVTPTEIPAEKAAQPEPAPEPLPLSPEELACVKKGGSWSGAGQGAKACIRPTHDAGKSCRRESDCEGYCLSRSMTCAPITPMFGCNDIVQDNGVVVTLCID